MKRLVLLGLLLIASLGAWTQEAAEPSTLLTGAEVLFSRHCPSAVDSLLREGRIAVVANQTSIAYDVHLVDTLLRAGRNVCAIFCPEHGFRGEAAAGAHVKSSKDDATGLPIISLYGTNKKPTQEQLAEIDVVVFDLQDVGCRFYTYLSTLHYVMEACAERGIPLVVLDRPNPNGHYVDGPVLEKGFTSFVGMHPVPIVYGMTILEYADMINGEGWLRNGEKCLLYGVEMIGYRRDSTYDLPIPPSPNLRNSHAIALYPSLCLFEGTTIGVGRGTPYPFEVIGNKADTLDLRTAPTPARLELRYLTTLYNRTPKGQFFLKNNFFNKLAGNSELRHQIENHVAEADIRASWKPAIGRFLRIRQRYLRYPDIPLEP